MIFIIADSAAPPIISIKLPKRTIERLQVLLTGRHRLKVDRAYTSTRLDLESKFTQTGQKHCLPYGFTQHDSNCEPASP